MCLRKFWIVLNYWNQFRSKYMHPYPTLVQRCHSGQQGRVWKNAASKALYLQDKAKGDIVSKALLSTAVSYPLRYIHGLNLMTLLTMECCWSCALHRCEGTTLNFLYFFKIYFGAIGVWPWAKCEGHPMDRKSKTDFLSACLVGFSFLFHLLTFNGSCRSDSATRSQFIFSTAK